MPQAQAGKAAGRPGGRRPGVRPLTALAQLLAFVTVAAVGGITGVGLVMPATVGVAAGAQAATEAFAALPQTLAAPSLPQTSVMLAADSSPIAWFYDEDRTEVPLSRMSPLVRQALVAVEDSRFYQHGAADLRGLARAAVNDVTGGNRQGASTLTQQYVKNALLETAVLADDKAGIAAATAPTASRKLRELRLAIAVEQALTKDQILERYLNIVYFGEHAYGVEAAAERYFGVSAARLSLAQAATLAGMVRDPSLYDPVAHPKEAKARRDVVLGLMLAQGMITQAAHDRAVATAVTTPGHPLPNGCSTAGVAAYFCEYVVRSIGADPRYAALGRTPAERLDAVARGGLTITTTLDTRLEDSAQRTLLEQVPVRGGAGLGTAAVTVEPGTGKVLAMAQNRSYSLSAGPGRTSVNWSVDAALGGAAGFQTGSSFKPFTLAAWLAAGHSASDVVDATPRAFPFSDFTACGQTLRGSTPYAPGNSEGTETGPMTVTQATANSVNVAYIAMETQLDLCDVAHTAESLGVHLASPARPCEASGPGSTQLPTCLPSLTLGVESIAPLTMAAAYAGFATGGLYCPPDPVTRITRSGGDTTVTGPGAPATTAHGPGTTRPVALPGVRCTQALEPSVADGVNATLRHVLTEGTAASVGPVPGYDSAGKTGTTNGPYDTWFVGYTTRRATAVWVGEPGDTAAGRRPLRDVTVAGTTYGTVFGATLAAPIWRQIMTVAQQGLPAEVLP